MVVLRAKISEAVHLAPVFLALRELDDIPVIFIIHSEDEVEDFEVANSELASVACHFISPATKRFGHAGVWFVAGVHPDGSRRVTCDPVGVTLFLDQMAKDVFSGGRATDIAHANEE